MPAKLSYSQMSIEQLVAEHNALAAERSVPALQSWHGDRVALVTKVALLNATPKCRAVLAAAAVKVGNPKRAVGRPKGRAPSRNAVLDALAHVTHFADRVTGEKFKTKTRPDLIAVGMPYDAVIELVRKKLPGASITYQYVKWVDHMAREGERFARDLPKRPRRVRYHSPAKRRQIEAALRETRMIDGKPFRRRYDETLVERVPRPI